MNRAKLLTFIKDYNLLLFLLGIGFGWLVMWLLVITFAVISL